MSCKVHDMEGRLGVGYKKHHHANSTTLLHAFFYYYYYHYYTQRDEPPGKGRGRLPILNIVFLYNQTTTTQTGRGKTKGQGTEYSDKRPNFHRDVTLNTTFMVSLHLSVFSFPGGWRQGLMDGCQTGSSQKTHTHTAKKHQC